MDYKEFYECEMKRADKAEDELAAAQARIAELEANSITWSPVTDEYPPDSNDKWYFLSYGNGNIEQVSRRTYGDVGRVFINMRGDIMVFAPPLWCTELPPPPRPEGI